MGQQSTLDKILKPKRDPRLCGLYGISDENLTPYKQIFEMLEQSILGGLKIFQFRDKTHSDQEIANLVKELQDFCRQKDVLFVMNDRLYLAIAIGADALHIGVLDDDPKIVRRKFSGLVGVSCYNDLKLAYRAQDEGVDYVAFGAFFPSKTKPNASLVKQELLIEAKCRLIPSICAIGGINQSNVSTLKNADMIAVINGLWQGDIRKNAEELLQNWHEIKFSD